MRRVLSLSTLVFFTLSCSQPQSSEDESPTNTTQNRTLDSFNWSNIEAVELPLLTNAGANLALTESTKCVGRDVSETKELFLEIKNSTLEIPAQVTCNGEPVQIGVTYLNREGDSNTTLYRYEEVDTDVLQKVECNASTKAVTSMKRWTMGSEGKFKIEEYEDQNGRLRTNIFDSQVTSPDTIAVDRYYRENLEENSQAKHDSVTYELSSKIGSRRRIERILHQDDPDAGPKPFIDYTFVDFDGDAQGFSYRTNTKYNTRLINFFGESGEFVGVYEVPTTIVDKAVKEAKSTKIGVDFTKIELPDIGLPASCGEVETIVACDGAKDPGPEGEVLSDSVCGPLQNKYLGNAVAFELISDEGINSFLSVLMSYGNPYDGSQKSIPAVGDVIGIKVIQLIRGQEPTAIETKNLAVLPNDVFEVIDLGSDCKGVTRITPTGSRVGLATESSLGEKCFLQDNNVLIGKLLQSGEIRFTITLDDDLLKREVTLQVDP